MIPHLVLLFIMDADHFCMSILSFGLHSDYRRSPGGPLDGGGRWLDIVVLVARDRRAGASLPFYPSSACCTVLAGHTVSKGALLQT